MDTLFLHLSPHSRDGATAWLKAGSGMQALGHHALATLAERHPGSRCVVFLSASDCLLTTVEVSGKQLRQAGNALSWLIEEQVGEDADNLHVVAGPSSADNTTPLLAVSSALLEDVLAQLRSAGLRVLAVLPDIVLLSGADANWHLAELDDGRVALRTGELAGAVLEADLLETMLDAALNEQVQGSAEPALTAALGAALQERVQAWLAAHPALSCEFSGAFDMAHALDAAPDWTRHPANLLQGRFSVVEHFSLPAGLRMAAMFIAVAIGVQLVAEWVNLAYYRHQAGKLETVAAERYRQLFPEASLPEKGRTAWIRKSLGSHLAGSGSGNSVLPELTRVAESLQGSGLNTQRVDFTGGVLTLDVDAHALAEIDGLKQRLDTLGLHSEIVSANAQNGIIRGRLRVGGGA